MSFGSCLLFGSGNVSISSNISIGALGDVCYVEVASYWEYPLMDLLPVSSQYQPPATSNSSTCTPVQGCSCSYPATESTLCITLLLSPESKTSNTNQPYCYFFRNLILLHQPWPLPYWHAQTQVCACELNQARRVPYPLICSWFMKFILELSLAKIIMLGCLFLFFLSPTAY